MKKKKRMYAVKRKREMQMFMEEEERKIVSLVLGMKTYIRRKRSRKQSDYKWSSKMVTSGFIFSRRFMQPVADIIHFLFFIFSVGYAFIIKI